MIKELKRLNKLYITTIISLLICILFFSYFNVNHTVEVLKKSIESENQSSKIINNETLAKTSGNTNKLSFANDRLIEAENEEILFEKALADTHQGSLGRKWMFYYVYLFIILFISTYILYIKGWFIKFLNRDFNFSRCITYS